MLIVEKLLSDFELLRKVGTYKHLKKTNYYTIIWFKVGNGVGAL